MVRIVKISMNASIPTSVRSSVKMSSEVTAVCVRPGSEEMEKQVASVKIFQNFVWYSYKLSLEILYLQLLVKIP